MGSASSFISTLSTGTLHVLTITSFYPKRGDESSGCFVAEPLAEMVKMKVRSTVFAVEPFYRTKSHETASAPKAEWFQYGAIPGGVGLASSGVGLFRRIRSRFKELHAQSPVDVIHAHGALPCGRAAALLSGEFKIPYVVTVHGLDAFSSRQVSGWPGAWCEKASRRVYAGARRVIGVSARVCEEVKRNMGGLSAAVVIHNGVDPLRFTPGEDPEQPTVLTVGNLIPTKGHELMVYALKALLPEFPQLTWEVIGDGTERTRIRLLAERLGVLQNIRFRGRQDRDAVGQAFRRCTVFALPSCYEALGCVYLEAMACGKASVGCEGQGIAEIIRHGDSGWLVPPNGREGLVAGLRVLLANEVLRRQIGARGRETVMNSFTLKHQAKRLVKIFEESKG